MFISADICEIRFYRVYFICRRVLYEEELYLLEYNPDPKACISMQLKTKKPSSVGDVEVNLVTKTLDGKGKSGWKGRCQRLL